ncbi:hypothetical protein [Streptomyces althioticus]|uniref:hypothetical protein n=1 Tax=Streptomyces althioticus TaxID=83380 RepID=UPI0037A278E9
MTTDVRGHRVEEAVREAGAVGGGPDGGLVDLAGAAEPVGGAVAAEPCDHLGTAAVGGEERRCDHTVA